MAESAIQQNESETLEASIGEGEVQARNISSRCFVRTFPQCV